LGFFYENIILGLKPIGWILSKTTALMPWLEDKIKEAFSFNLKADLMPWLKDGLVYSGNHGF